MKKGLVSIIIPAYNCSTYLEQAITSAVTQSYEHKEVIIVDDGSTDDTLMIAKKFASSNVNVLHQQNGGASKARNHGLSVANGEWIQFLDADDFLRKDKIEKQLNQIDSPNQISVCKTVHFTNEISKGIQDSDHFFQEYLNDPIRFLIKLYGGFDFNSGMIQPNAYLTHRSIIDKAGGWNETLSLDDDGEFFCRVLLNSGTIKYISEPMNFYRKFVSGGSLSGAKSQQAYESQYHSIRLKHEYLLKYNTSPDLIPFIHTATYKAIQLLLHRLYPTYSELFNKVKHFSDSLIKHPSRGREVFGGNISNFIGNRISWKLLKRLQILTGSKSA